MRTIQGALAIEGNTLSEDQITAILNGKPVFAPPKNYKKHVTRLMYMSNQGNGIYPARKIFNRT